MQGLNKCILLGNLGADPELRMTQGGQAVLNLRLATTEQYLDRDKKKQERTEWHSVTIWGKRGEALGKILHKGDRLLIEGRLHYETYDDRDGNKRYRTSIVATEVLLQGSKNGGKREPERAKDEQHPLDGPNFGVDDDDDLPF